MLDLWSLFSRRPSCRRPARKQPPRRLSLEQLEDRAAPAAIGNPMPATIPDAAGATNPVVHGAASNQGASAGNQGALVANNAAAPSGPATLADLQHLIFSDLTLAQQFQSDGLDQTQQQFGFWFVQAASQSPTNAFNLVFDEISLTTGAITVLQDEILGHHQDDALLVTLGQIEASIANNPLASTTAGQAIMTLTGPLILAGLQ